MTSIIIILISFFVALNGLLFKTLKDPDGPTRWKNINIWGKLILFALIILSALSVNQVYRTQKESKLVADSLSKERDDQKEFSDYLIKVASNCDGYTVLVRGTVDFDSPPSEQHVRSALRNMFLKYMTPKIEAINKYGEFRCNLFLGNEPEIKRFLNLKTEPLQSGFMRDYYSTSYGNPFFFELSYNNIKPLNDDGILFIKFEDSKIRFDFTIEEYYLDFQRLYGIHSINIKEIIVADFPPIRPNEDFIFL